MNADGRRFKTSIGVYRRPSAVAVSLLALVGAGCTSGGEGSPADPAGGARLIVGGPGREAGRFYRPRAIAVHGNCVYVVDMTGRIQVFDQAGAPLRSWRIPETERGYPTGLGFSSDGHLAVADTHNYCVRIYSAEGRLLRSIGEEGAGPGQFTYVTDVAFDSLGQMFVSEHGRSDRVQKFSREGEFLSEWGGPGEAPGEFHRPQALAVDAQGAVYVADAANHRVQKFSGAGEVMGVWGGPGREPGHLLYPYDLAFTPGGYLLVCEYGNNRIQAFDGQGRSCGVWGRAGRQPGEFATPWGVAWAEPPVALAQAGHGGIWVVDTGNHRVQLLAAPAWLGRGR